MEVLFNDGGSELSYRISRGVAVLIGKNRKECSKIYSNIKKFYKMRSHLVHAGKSEGINIKDIYLLRYYVRKSISEIVRLGLSKDDLSVELTERGF